MLEKIDWCSETNWSVIQGDLRKTILLDTSTSLPFKADVERTAFEPLFLKPSPSAELGPCEITVKFSQKHEIHRVYLWSTARVFEMYYATQQQGENEYLCTTRCVLVKRKCHSFQSDCSSIRASSEGTKIDHTDEDGWIDVRVPGFVLPDEAYPSLKTSEVKKQEDCSFYEGTAEFYGASPCIYLTIRLLSLYTKGSACIGQLCILASPTSSLAFSEPSSPAVRSGNASLLAMLVPSLIQLSRAGSEAQGRSSSDVMKLCNGSDMETEGRIHMEKPEEDIEKVERLQQSSGAAKEYTGWSTRDEGQSDRVKDGRSHASGAVICTGGKTREASESVRSNGESHQSTSCNCRCEEALTKLNEKIDRIVTHCANLQENMIKPLVSMETRLKQLEEKLNAVLTSELIKRANFIRDGSFSEENGGIEKDGCQSRKQKAVGFDKCKRFNCNDFDDDIATEDDSGSDSKDTSCSCSSSDSSNVSDENDVSQDDARSEDIEENENEPDERNILVVMEGSESCVLSCMSGSNDEKNHSVTDDDSAEEGSETEEHTSDADDIEKNVKDHLGSADALNTTTLLSVKPKWSIEEAVVSALSDFVATAAAATDGSCSERASITSMNIIDKESWRLVVTDAILSSQSIEESQLLVYRGTDCHDQLVAAGLGNSNLFGASGSTISTIRCTNELQLDGVQEELGEPGIQYESLKLKEVVEPLPLDQNLEGGFEILNHIKEHNQQIKNAFKVNSEHLDDSLLDVKFVVDKNCQFDSALEVLLGGHDLATETCLSNRLLNSCNDDCLLSAEEDPTSVECMESSSNQIDKFSMSEELKQINPNMEGWRDTTVNGLDCLGENIDLLCSEDLIQTDPVPQTVDPSLSAHRSSFYSVSDKQKEVRPVDAASAIEGTGFS